MFVNVVLKEVYFFSRLLPKRKRRDAKKERKESGVKKK